MLLQMALFNSFYGWVILQCICASHFMYPYVDGRLGCSHVLAIVNSIAINVRVHVSFQIRIFSQYMSRSRTVGSYGDSFNIHWKEYSLKLLRQYSLEGLILKLKLQYFGHLMWIIKSLEKTLVLRKIEGRKRAREYEMVGWHHWLNGHEFEQTLGVGDGQGSLVCCSHGVAKSQI